TASQADEVPVDLSGFKPDSGVEVTRDGGRLSLAWPMGEAEFGRLIFKLRSGQPGLMSLGTSRTSAADIDQVLSEVEPLSFLTVGTRPNPGGGPPNMDPFNVFFDSPAKLSHQTYRSRFELRGAKVISQGRRSKVSLSDLTIGPFRGSLEVTVYAGARLVHVEA